MTVTKKCKFRKKWCSPPPPPLCLCKVNYSASFMIAFIGPGIRNGGIKRGGNPISIYSNGCQSEHDNDDILEDLLMFLSSEFGVVPLGLAKSYAAGSCQEVADASPQKKAGLYWITDGNNTKQEYCNI